MINKPDQIRIDYFKVEGSAGGNQDWYKDKDYWMHIGGCAALAACDMTICLARNLGLKDACPINSNKISKKAYIDLGMKMKPYISPRIGGVILTSIYTGGLARFLRSRGYEASFMTCQGGESYDKALFFVKKALTRNMPVAYLMLHHHNQDFKGLNWHWFVVTGCEKRKGRDRLLYHTYGGAYSVDFEDLWNTGRFLKGGMVALKDIKKVKS